MGSKNSTPKQKSANKAKVVSIATFFLGIACMFIPSVGPFIGSASISCGVSGFINAIQQNANKKKKDFSWGQFASISVIGAATGALTGATSAGASYLASKVITKGALKAASQGAKYCAQTAVKMGVSSLASGVINTAANCGKQAIQNEKGQVDFMKALKYGANAAISTAIGQVVGAGSEKFIEKYVKESKHITTYSSLANSAGSGIQGALSAIVSNILKQKILSLQNFVQYMLKKMKTSKQQSQKAYQKLISLRVISKNGQILQEKISLIDLGEFNHFKKQIQKLFKKITSIFNKDIIISAGLNAAWGGFKSTSQGICKNIIKKKQSAKNGNYNTSNKLNKANSVQINQNCHQEVCKTKIKQINQKFRKTHKFKGIYDKGKQDNACSKYKQHLIKNFSQAQQIISKDLYNTDFAKSKEEAGKFVINLLFKKKTKKDKTDIQQAY